MHLTDRERLVLEINQAVFFDTNPIPIKTAMHMAGLIPSATLRLPGDRLLR